MTDESPTYDVDPYDLDTARDVLLHTGGFSRSLIALCAEVVVADYDRRSQTEDALRAALIELIEASRGLAFFDQIKCHRWNTAYAQARKAAGLDGEEQ